MTTLPATAAEAWELLARAENPLPPECVLDMLMESQGCDRGRAVRELREAAVVVLEELFFNDCEHWYGTPRTVMNRIRSGNYSLVGCHGRMDPIGDIRRNRLAASQKWLPWCAAAERAVAILRAIDAIP